MVDDELILELKKCLDRYWRTMALPLDQRAPFTAGIVKLETRIEQLRAATGMNTEQFVSRVRECFRPLEGRLITDDVLFDLAGDCLDRAGACFRMGDKSGTVTALSDLERCVKDYVQTPKQEALPL